MRIANPHKFDFSVMQPGISDKCFDVIGEPRLKPPVPPEFASQPADRRPCQVI